MKGICRLPYHTRGHVELQKDKSIQPVGEITCSKVTPELWARLWPNEPYPETFKERAGKYHAPGEYYVIPEHRGGKRKKGEPA